jgi:hypothetical protein
MLLYNFETASLTTYKRSRYMDKKEGKDMLLCKAPAKIINNMTMVIIIYPSPLCFRGNLSPY